MAAHPRIGSLRSWSAVGIFALVLAGGGLGTVAPAGAAPTAAPWVATWSSSNVSPDTSGLSATGFANQTIRQIAHTSIAGTEVRLRLSNVFGSTPPSGTTDGGSMLDLARASSASPSAPYDLSGGTPALAGDPAPFRDPQLGQEQIFGISTAGHLFEVYRDSTTFALHPYDLSAAIGPAVPPLVGTPAPFVDPQSGAEQILARSVNGQVIDVARHLGDGGLGVYGLSGPGTPALAGDPAPFRDPQSGQEQIFGISTAGHLFEVYRDSTTFALHPYDLSAAIGPAVPPLVGTPAPFVDPQSGAEQILARSVNGQVIDVARHLGDGGLGVYGLSGPGTPALAGDPAPFRDPQSGQEQIFGISTAGDLFEVYRDSTTFGVAPYNLSGASTGSFPVVGRPSPFIDKGTGQEEIFARGTEGDSTAFDRLGGGLTFVNLNAEAGGGRVATGDPRPFTDPQSGGEQVLTNANGAAPPVAVSSAYVGLRAGGAGVVAGTNTPVTVGGSASFQLPAGTTIATDPILLSVPADSDLAVSLYLPGRTGPTTWHPAAIVTNYVAGGDQAGTVAAAPYATTSTSSYYLAGVDVTAPAGAGAVVALGASSTDGVGSTLGAERRWTNDLYRRIEAAGRGNQLSVLNAGISGNRLLTDGATSGQDTEARFARDVLGQPGVSTVIVASLANNDIGLNVGPGGQSVTAYDIIVGYQRLIAQAHAAGIAIVGGTVTPDEGAYYYTPAGEAKRQAVNSWILTSGAFDGAVDFATAVADPSDPHRILPAYDSGDHLHPNDVGYQAMANSVDLALLRPS